MRHAGDGRTFIASAAVLMAGLVIATMLAINWKLQNALSPTSGSAGAPTVKVVPAAPAPKLQNTAPASIATSPAAPVQIAEQVAAASQPQVAKPSDTKLVAAPKPAAGTASPASKVVAVTVPAVHLPVVTVPVALPSVAPSTPTVTTTLVTVVPSVVGDILAAQSADSTGAGTHRKGDKGQATSTNPDLTAASTGQSAQADKDDSDEGDDGDNATADSGGDDSHDASSHDASSHDSGSHDASSHDGGDGHHDHNGESGSGD